MRTAKLILAVALAGSLTACSSLSKIGIGKGGVRSTADLYVKALVNKDGKAAVKLNDYLAKYQNAPGFIQQVWLDKSPKPVSDNDPRLKLVKKNRQALKPMLAEMDNIVAQSVYAAGCDTKAGKVTAQKNGKPKAKVAELVMTCQVPSASDQTRQALNTVKLEDTAALQKVIAQWKNDVVGGVNIKTVEVPFQLYSDKNTPWSNPNITQIIRPVTEAAAGLR